MNDHQRPQEKAGRRASKRWSSALSTTTLKVLLFAVVLTIHLPNASSDPSTRAKSGTAAHKKKVPRMSRVKPKTKPMQDANDWRRKKSILDFADFHVGEKKHTTKSDDDDDDEPGDELEIQLMEDEAPLKFKNFMKEDYEDDAWATFSALDDDGGSIQILKGQSTFDGKNVFAATVRRSNGIVYQIREIEPKEGDKQIYTVERVEAFDPEFEGPEVEEGLAQSVQDLSTIDHVDAPTDLSQNGRNLRGGATVGNSTRQLQGITQLDVMVVYTRDAACANSGKGRSCSLSAADKRSMLSTIDLAVAETNTAYKDSKIPAKLRLVDVHYEPWFNDRTTSWEKALRDLRSTGAPLQYVHARRDEVGADFVALIVNMSGGYCGIGYRPTQSELDNKFLAPTLAFSVTQWNCATGYYSFGHELAHNMGCNHDEESTNNAGTYNFGYKYSSANRIQDRFRTIMAYNCDNNCNREQIFSSPNVYFKGRKAGNNRANNAAYITQHLQKYANFRPTMISTSSITTGITPVAQTSNPTSFPTGAPVFAPTSSPEFVPTGSPTNLRQLDCGFAAGLIAAHGNMFDIEATEDVSITNFAVHSTAATSVIVEVWKKKATGSFVSSLAANDQSQWEMIGRVAFMSNGQGEPSPLPVGSFPPVFIEDGTIQAFYVTFDKTTNYNRYSGGTVLSSVLASNGDIRVLEGYAKGYDFGDNYYPRNWNGVVYYELGLVSASPVEAPTGVPTVAPTRFPTEFPTGFPTPNPTHSPVVIPTSAHPTGAPTGTPTDGPTVSPTGAPTGFVSEELTIATTFEGGNGQAGNMFTLTADAPITIGTIDVHTYSTGSVRVLVYVMDGSYEGYEQDPGAWTLVCDTNVVGSGSSNPTPVPKDAFTAVAFEAGETRSFYVTLSEAKIRYTNGNVVYNDGVITIDNSSGKRYPFKDTFKDRLWNGVVHYRMGTGGEGTPPPSLPALSSNAVCTGKKELVTTMKNRNGSYGSMFDVKAKRDLLIENFSIHTFHAAGTEIDVKVFKYLPNVSFRGKHLDKLNWQLIGSGVVQCRGSGIPTPLPEGFLSDPVQVGEGMVQSFYVTSLSSGLRYTNGALSSQQTGPLPFAQNGDLMVYEGAGVGAPEFGGIFFPRNFNGKVHYCTPDDPSSGEDAAADHSSSSYDFQPPVNGMKEEGWPCDFDHDCLSGMCGDAPKQEWTAGSSGSLTNRGSQRRRELESGDDDDGEIRLCLNENGEHDEDGAE